VNHILPLLYEYPKTLANLFCVNKYLKEIGDVTNFVLSETGSIYKLHFYVNIYIKSSLYLWLHFIAYCCYCHADFPSNPYFAPNYQKLKTIWNIQSEFKNMCDWYDFHYFLMPNIVCGFGELFPLYGSPTRHGKLLWPIDKTLTTQYSRPYHIDISGYQSIVKYIQSEPFKVSLFQEIKKMFCHKINMIAQRLWGNTSNKDIPWFPYIYDVHWYVYLRRSNYIHLAILYVDADSVLSFFSQKG
jgi:hypothetical protein